MIVTTKLRKAEGRAPVATTAVEVRNIVKRFGQSAAVDDVSLSLETGHFLTLVGPSGCGKSTLLRMIAGLVEPDSGEIDLAGNRVCGKGVWVLPEQRAVGLVFQENTLFPHLTVADNVRFGIRKWDARVREERLDEVLALVDLPGYAGRFPHELSGGERQRVALARALAPAPTVLLLDEPFANLDPNLRAQVRSQTVEILRKADATVLFVTHDQQEAMSVGDRVAVMRNGRIEQVGAPREVFHCPCNQFVASSLGEAYFLKAQVAGEGELNTEIGPCTCGRAFPEGDIEIMVRPHDVTFEVAEDGADRVAGVEFQGAYILYDVRLASGQLIRCQLPHTTDVGPGTPVQVRLAHGHDAIVVPAS